MMRIASYRWWPVLVSASFAFLCFASTDGSAANAEETPPPSESLKGMQERASAMKIAFAAGEPKDPIVLVPRPIMRYSAPSIGVADATLWCFTHSKRPVAMLKVESRLTKFSCGVTSLSSQLIEVHWDESRSFYSSEAGLIFRAIPNAPHPANTDTARAFQMKQITQRFSATFTVRDQKEEMRRLPRALYRYSLRSANIIDGAVFAFVSTGTNPNTFLVVELHRGPGDAPVWRYAVARLTIAAVSVRLDNQPVWEKPAPRRRVVRSGRPLRDGTYATSGFPKEP